MTDQAVFNNTRPHQASAIIVAEPDIHAYFEAIRPDWDVQHVVESVDQMWADLDSGKLNTESEVVVIDEPLFHASEGDNDSDFAVVVATFAPIIPVIITARSENQQAQIIQEVEKARRKYRYEPGRFYFLNTWEDPESLPEILQGFLNEYDTWQVQEKLARQQGKSVKSPEVPIAVQVAPDEAQLPEVEIDESRRGMIFSSTSSKGGSGKTTVALLTAGMIRESSRLAAERGLMENPLSVCVVDLDVEDGQIGFILQQVKPTAMNIYAARDYSIESIEKFLIYDKRLDVHALLAPTRARIAHHLGPEFYYEIISKLSTIFDVVIIDTSVRYIGPLLTEVAFPISNAIMFVTNVGVGSVFGMSRWIDDVTIPIERGGPGIDIGKIGVVVNQSMANVGVERDLLLEAARGAKLLVPIPMDSAAVVAATNRNNLVSLLRTHEDISNAYFKLIKKLPGLKDLPLVAPMDEAARQKTAKQPVTGTPLSGGKTTGRREPVRQQATPQVQPTTDEKKKRRLFGSR